MRAKSKPNRGGHKPPLNLTSMENQTQQITYTRRDKKTGADVQHTAQIVSVKQYAADDRELLLSDGKRIFIEPTRAELWGKSGSFLAVIHIVQ